jgi:cytidine deaminase
MSPTDLINEADLASKNAYAPYSDYQVGAVLLCTDGTLFKGCNVENASYGLTNCAERTALFSAIAAGQSSFTALAIASSGEPTPFPCGACRQVLVEFCPPTLPVYIKTSTGYETITLAELLPHGFDLKASATDA